VHGRWLELADGVFARRYAELDLTVGLVLGDELALVVDTRGDEVQGAELAASVRRITALPLAVAITHAHFDHCFGTRALVDPARPTPVYAQRGCAPTLRDSAAAQREQWSARYLELGDPDTAMALATARIVAPEHLVDLGTELDLGGRGVVLRHPGAGHTDHDLVVQVPDAAILFAGDLVEQGAPPDFTDADPSRWPTTVDALLALRPRLVVPGHGEPVPPTFLETQRDELAAVAKLCASVGSGALSSADAVRLSPYPEETTRAALARQPSGPGRGNPAVTKVRCHPPRFPP
jgi:glyoxylase-like metal-dependent hydrolase (beta-lactamase superfamily II)